VYRPVYLDGLQTNGTKMRLYSETSGDGVVEFEIGNVPGPKTVADSWARFYGVDYIPQGRV
jgi:hypothetical protein